MGKGDGTDYRHFLIFPHLFEKTNFFLRVVKIQKALKEKKTNKKTRASKSGAYTPEGACQGNVLKLQIPILVTGTVLFRKGG